MPASVVVAGACALMLLVISAAWWLASRGAGEEAVSIITGLIGYTLRFASPIPMAAPVNVWFTCIAWNCSPKVLKPITLLAANS